MSNINLTVRPAQPAADWTSQDPTLEQFEIGFESDTGKAKVNLSPTKTHWTALSYFGQLGQPYDIACQVTGVPGTSAVLLRFIATRAFTLAASGHKGTAGTAATAQTDFLVKVNGTTKATLRFAASGVTITIVGGTAAAIAAGDIITIVAPASADATLADLGFTLAGTLL